MKLYFVRHTTAADYLANDAQRPLTRQGEDEARHVGIALAGFGVQPSRIFSSPMLRAQQTAGIIGRELKFAGAIETLEELTNGRTTPSLLEALPVVGGEVVLVGHMPSLAEHLAAILDKPNSNEFAFGKGSVACVELESPDGTGGKLLFFKHLT